MNKFATYLIGGIILTLAQLVGMSFAHFQPIPQPLQQDEVLIYTSTFDEVWRLNTMTGEYSPYFQLTPEIAFRHWYFDFNQQVLYAIETPREAWLPTHTGTFNLVQVDLQTMEKEVLWQHTNLERVGAYPLDADKLIIVYYEDVEKRDPRTLFGYRGCLFDLSSRSCTEIPFRTASLLIAATHVSWLDDSSFIASSVTHTPFFTTNLNGEEEVFLNEWLVIASSPIPNSRDMLVLAEPVTVTPDNETSKGFYILNLDTLTLSDQIHPAPAAMLDSATIEFSSDGKYLLFGWNYNHPDRPYLSDAIGVQQVLDYESWTTIFELESQDATSLRWLPDASSLFGRLQDREAYSTTFVRIDLPAGEMVTLLELETDEPISFTVVQ